MISTLLHQLVTHTQTQALFTSSVERNNQLHFLCLPKVSKVVLVGFQSCFTIFLSTFTHAFLLHPQVSPIIQTERWTIWKMRLRDVPESTGPVSVLRDQSVWLFSAHDESLECMNLPPIFIFFSDLLNFINKLNPAYSWVWIECPFTLWPR